jgi:hypothetical protein
VQFEIFRTELFRNLSSVLDVKFDADSESVN